MGTLPLLQTERLILRSFTLADAPEVQKLAGQPEVALMTIHIPYPYPDGAAEAWIATHGAGFEQGLSFIFAITRRENGALMGGISLMADRDNGTAELGYWLGIPFWNQGYATEAAGALVAYGFETLGLRRIYARYFRHNPASGRVMRKLGMIFEGRNRQAQRRADRVADEECYGLLAEDWRSLHRPAAPAVVDRSLVRPVKSEDRPWVRSLLREHWSGEEVISRDRLLRPADLPGFVALIAGEPQGLATYEIRGDECELVTLNSLAPRLGLGWRLVDAVRAAAAAAGCRRLWLVTTNDNTEALAFYQRIGFRLAALHRDAIAKSRELKPAIPETGHLGIPLRDEIELELEIKG
jgi:[ribosomal protein S5]-alanine N-acetyltransferase